jgi:glycosyltransferase involved in cell wall biosynthesis
MKSSIIIPTYNRSSYLGETLASVINQTDTNWEIIVVDDNSTDNTITMVSELCRKDNRIKLVVKPKHFKKGPASSRNLGFIESSGDYIIFLDSDDLLMPYCLQQRIEYSIKFPEFNCWVFNGAGFKKDDPAFLFLWNVARTQSDLERFFALDVPWQTAGPIWRKAALIESKLKWDAETEPMDDVDFHIGALLHQEIRHKVFWESPYDYLFRIGSSDNISQSNYYNQQKVEARFYFFLKYYESLDDGKLLFLRPILLNVLQTCVRIKQYSKAYDFIRLSGNKKIITLSETRFLRSNILEMQLLQNRLFRFPTPKIEQILAPIKSSLFTKPA